MPAEDDRRVADAERWGIVLTKLENIEAKLDTQNARLNNHGERLSALERSKAAIYAVAAALGIGGGYAGRHL